MGDSVGPAGLRGRPRRGRYLLAALAVALVAGLGASLPVLAQDEKGGIEPQIVGGEPVPGGKYRFMASIQADTNDNNPYQDHFCGGTLIDRNSVLTAAHCVEFIGKETTRRTLGYKDVRIAVGVTNLNTDTGQRRGIDKLSDIHIHPDYGGAFKFDAAVIKLGRPIESISPIALARPASGNALESPPGNAIVTGWGSTVAQPAFPPGNEPKFPRRMQEADPPLVADGKCKKAYDRPGVPNSLALAPALMVCAGKTREDTCGGDSGGPMFVGTTQASRRQIGITSYGAGCGAEGFPGVYTEVNASPIFGFIQRAADR